MRTPAADDCPLRSAQLSGSPDKQPLSPFCTELPNRRSIFGTVRVPSAKSLTRIARHARASSKIRQTEFDRGETVIARMTPDDRSAGMHLLEKGTLVDFKVLDVQVLPGPDDAEFGLRIDLRLNGDDDEGSNDVEWGGLGFCFVLAVLSFADARPRGASEMDYKDDDQITLVDFLEGFSFVRGELHFRGDYIRGRRLKTNITIKADGAVTLETVGRGKTALQWLDRLKGKKMMSLIS